MELMTINKTNSAISANGTNNIGQLFNEVLSENVFNTYLEPKSENTKVRHIKELRKFAEFLKADGIGYTYKDSKGEQQTPDEMRNPIEWDQMTFGLIEGYKHYMINKGFSVNTTNQTLYIIKAYAGLAGKAGYINYGELARIREVRGYKSGEAVHIDKQRKATGKATRIGYKKETSCNLTADQVNALKGKFEYSDETKQPKELTTLKEKRDALIFALFLDMGLRESEMLSLTEASFDMDKLMLHWHREKTNNNGHEAMSADVIKAAVAYLKAYKGSVENEIRNKNAERNINSESNGKKASDKSDLFATVNKWGQVTGGLTMRGLVSIVKEAGLNVGIDNLSPHDLRHSMALRAYLAGSPLKSIQRRLGHSTVTTTERYIDIEALNRYDDIKLSF